MRILHEIDESKHYDLFIVLDCGDTGRLEVFCATVRKCRTYTLY